MRLLIDIDGTVILEDKGINSSKEFFQELKNRNIEYLLATNSIKSSKVQKKRLQKAGISVNENRILNPIMAINQYILEKGINRVYTAGSHDEIIQVRAEQDEVHPQLIILCDFEKENFSYDDLQKIFDLLQKGCPIVAISYSPFYFNYGKKVLDTGAFVRIFESAVGIRIPVFGKPSEKFFNMACSILEGDEIWMIGDDPATDIIGAEKAGLKTVLIRSGKYQEKDEYSSKPDIVIDNLMDLFQL